MAKHAKPTLAGNLRKAGSRSTAIIAFATAGMFAAGSMASASVDQGGGKAPSAPAEQSDKKDEPQQDKKDPKPEKKDPKPEDKDKKPEDKDKKPEKKDDDKKDKDRDKGKDKGKKGGGDDFHNTNGVVNVNDNNTQANGQACNNNVPVNVLGVQVPVEDATGAAGIGADDTQAGSASSKDCDQNVKQYN